MTRQRRQYRQGTLSGARRLELEQAGIELEASLRRSQAAGELSAGQVARLRQAGDLDAWRRVAEELLAAGCTRTALARASGITLDAVRYRLQRSTQRSQQLRQQWKQTWGQLWLQHLDDYLAWWNRHGRRPGPRDEGDGARLAKWLVDQRHAHRRGKLAASRVEALQRVGLAGDSQPGVTRGRRLDEDEQRRLRQAASRAEWVQVAAELMDDEQVSRAALAEAEGVATATISRWLGNSVRDRGGGGRPNDDHWHQMLAACEEFWQQHGRLPRSGVDDTSEAKLGNWLDNQRAFVRRGELSSARRASWEASCLPARTGGEVLHAS